MNIQKEMRGVKQEAKNLLSKEQHIVLKSYLQIDPGSTKKHEDHIFMDKKNRLLDIEPAVLRVRSINDTHTLEFKIPQPNGDVLKYSDVLNELEYDELFSNKILLSEATVFAALKERGIVEPFSRLGSITTIRSRAPFKNKWGAKILLDQIWLTDKDFICKIKVETKDAARSQQILKEICELHDIPLVETPPKITLYYKTLGL